MICRSISAGFMITPRGFIIHMALWAKLSKEEQDKL